MTKQVLVAVLEQAVVRLRSMDKANLRGDESAYVAALSIWEETGCCPSELADAAESLAKSVREHDDGEFPGMAIPFPSCLSARVQGSDKG